jgi:hypothetical protein
MPSISTKSCGPLTLALLLVAFACLGLAACGSSSGGSSSGTSSSTAVHTTAEAAPTTPASSGTTPAGRTPTSTAPTIRTERQLEQIYACLVRDGIKLPPLRHLNTANPALARSPHYQATLAKCRHAVLG